MYAVLFNYCVCAILPTYCRFKASLVTRCVPVLLQERQHPLTGQRAANFRQLANQ